MVNDSTLTAYTGLRHDIIALIDHAPRRVLDAGCSNGTLGAFLKATYPGVQVTGIEADPVFAAEARQRLDGVIHADLNTLDAQALSAGIDLLVCADVLEHTQWPADTLRTLLSCTTAEACIIISLPNVQHWTAIMNLLAGRWPSRDRGLFDRTHLRFFTLASIRALAAECGCDIVRIRRNYRITDTPGARINALSRLFGFPPLRAFFTYQYVVCMVRSRS